MREAVERFRCANGRGQLHEARRWLEWLCHHLLDTDDSQPDYLEMVETLAFLLQGLALHIEGWEDVKQEAHRWAKEAIRLRRDYQHHLEPRAWASQLMHFSDLLVSLEQDHLEEALEVRREAVAVLEASEDVISPEHARCHEELSDVLAHLGEHEEAQQARQRAEEISQLWRRQVALRMDNAGEG